MKDNLNFTPLCSPRASNRSLLRDGTCARRAASTPNTAIAILCESTKPAPTPISTRIGPGPDKIFKSDQYCTYSEFANLYKREHRWGDPGLSVARRTLTTSRKMVSAYISESEAIDRAKGGDIECFELLFRMHKKRVYSLCLRMVGNIELAEDLTQEAFLLLFRKIESFRGDSAFSTWLHRLTVNVVLMHVRKKKLPETSLDETLEANDDGAPQKEIASLDRALTGSIDRVVIERAIEDLPPGYRLFFVLHDVEGYEHNEIAEMMGCSIGNSKSQLHKARMKLRLALNVTRAENMRHKAPRLSIRPQPMPQMARSASAPGAD